MQAIFHWFVNQNPNRSPDKSIRILIGIRTNQLESQSEHIQLMPRTITARPVHEVNEHKLIALCMFIILSVATHGRYAS